jgi:hypothetical protein
MPARAAPAAGGSAPLAQHYSLTVSAMTFSFVLLLLLAGPVLGLALQASAQPSARAVRGAAPVVPLASEPPARLVVDAPLPEPLALGRVIIQYRTENLHIVPVYGPAALDVSPRIGHIHVTVDDLPWRWADASGEPLILNGFPPGPHRVLVELVDPTHRTLDRQTVSFLVPKPAGPDAHHGH